MSKIQPAVRKETRNVAIYCAIGAALMFLVFFIWHRIFPDKVPFDYTVFFRWNLRKPCSSAEFLPHGNDRSEGRIPKR